MIYLFTAALLFLLFGGSRIAVAGKQLGEAVRNFKRALGPELPATPAAPLAERRVVAIVSETQREPKRLPAKGESSASRREEADEG